MLRLIDKAAHGLYVRTLRAELRTWKIPRHVGIIMDGNRRYARLFNAGRLADGHELGSKKLDEVLSWCERAGVEVVSVWAFSVDNFKRSQSEVDDLMALFERKFRELVTDPRVHRDGIRIRGVGRLELLPPGLRQAINDAERATAHYRKRTLNIGMAYGGREEILDAFSRYLEDGEKAGLSLADIRAKLTHEAVEERLYSTDLPEPDLIIRTSGEVRLSGFMLWQSAHSEFYFCDTHWPAFREIDFLRALRAYHFRQRRFGV